MASGIHLLLTMDWRRFKVTDQEITLRDIITTLEEEGSLVIESKHLPAVLDYFKGKETIGIDRWVEGFLMVWIKGFKGEEQ